MATPRKKKTEPPPLAPEPRLRRARRWALRGLAGIAAFYGVLILLFSFLPPPINLYQLGESFRLGGISKDWVSFDEIAPVMGRSVVAAEDANFCLHWGFDMAAIRAAVEEGEGRGASTLSQQVVKNTFLWHGRSWLRKAMEAVLTPVVELVWSKQRILEVYLNVAEFDEGIFGVQAAAQHHFGVDARDLSALQAARLAAVLPDPQGRSASNPSSFVKKRTRAIIAGAETIAADGRAGCFDRGD
ncbi:MAG: monofunctional biosynthetic peptidoglycan transglycosylase [Rhodobacterales bacterium RIFCSPHIGHO2_02_FULL_62_130]|nr:MAG: monofunctional biosynthetic peptidoglycan transglycosylase [Rhodobacterales bacterium RIFCSPHIGHO2_02_FULL_62_130]OHC56793.1 MAG: monofunctional biosynthetic peptidoglycan transglycosylase [Rhodobacterales bacterium RIFCSPHIGHO2_12_FULL_62_75]HCZ00695.1 monofunctional biosynthetic peptidoglycan transglycosylase [Rhodobacter sp.]